MERPILRITKKKYAGETTVVSMRLSRELLKDIDAVANGTGRLAFLPGCEGKNLKMPGPVLARCWPRREAGQWRNWWIVVWPQQNTRIHARWCLARKRRT